MMISGNIYGVVLNDREELEALAPEFERSPYDAAPKAPVVYMKPRSAIARGPVVHAGESLRLGATLALLFARDTARCTEENALAPIGAVALAADLSLPQAHYYRPTVHLANRDGFLILGEWTAPAFPNRISTSLEGGLTHIWSLGRLHRPPARLIADLSAFMTFKAGDVLLVGLPGDAPRIDAPGAVTISAPSMPPLHAEIRRTMA